MKGNNPKIVSVGTAFPERSYTQEEAWSALNYKDAAHFKRIFMKSGISKRHFWVDFSKAREYSWQVLQDEYKKGALVLSAQSVKSCFDGRHPLDLGSVTYVSCTGYQCPSVIHHLIDDLELPHDAFYTNILGMGCGGGFPGLKRAYDCTLQSKKPSLVVATEICSSCLFPEDGGTPDCENDYELLRANAIFADASASVLVGYDSDPRHPYILDFESNCNPEYLNYLGFVWRDSRWRVLLSRKVKDVAPAVVEPAVKRILSRNNLLIKDIQWFVIHAAGSAVLDNIRDHFGIPEKKMALSREILNQYGNCSSTTIGIIGKRLMEEVVDPGDRVLVISVGPGMEGGCTYLRFPER